MTFILFAIFFVCAISTFLIFDLVIRSQFERHRESWERDGKPHGFFFRPAETQFILSVPKLGSWLAMQAQYFMLIFRTPGWMIEEERLNKFAIVYRLLHVIGLVIWGFMVYLTFS